MITKSEFDRITDLLQAGQSKQALKLCKAGMKRHPKVPAFPHLAGVALSQAGNPREGAQYFMKALKLAPSSKDSQDNLATALVQSDQTNKARAFLRKLIRERQDTAYLSYQLAALEYQDHNAEAALDALNACIAQLEGATNPAKRRLLTDAYSLRGSNYQLTWNNAAAHRDFEAALELDPNNAKNLAKYAASLSTKMQSDAALKALEKAVSLAPDDVDVLVRYAIQLNQMGRRDEAAQILSSVIERQPQHDNALLNLLLVSSGEAASQLMPKLKMAYQNAAKGSYEQGKLAFGLAQCSAKTGQTEQANNWFVTANKKVAAIRTYDGQATADSFERAKTVFPLGSQPSSASASDGPMPIFVIGQPRSGTTLTEMVLSAHPSITGVGEQTIAGTLANPYIHEEAAYGPAEAAQFAANYRAELPDLPNGTVGVVDKMPGNYVRVGFLLTAFPNAVILNICRDPRDVAWSMWRVNFPAEGLNYTFDMAAMAHEANYYARYIRHWKTLFPGQVHDVHYEELVSDIEAQSQRLAKLCGVDWVPEMARPDRNTAPVRTASITQVRQKVNTSSIGGWRAHEEVFKPFMATLDPELWPGIA